MSGERDVWRKRRLAKRVRTREYLKSRERTFRKTWEPFEDIKQPHNPEEDYTYFKFLSLIDPAQAKSMGIETDSLVFISPYVSRYEAECNCGNHYSPLPYKDGSNTKAQHFHETFGGIYHYGMPNDSVSFSNKYIDNRAKNWVAEVHPLGMTSKDTYSNFHYRSLEVHVKRIRAFCTDSSHDDTREITEGVVAEKAYGGLIPYCHDHPLPEDVVPVSEFKQMEGQLFFRAQS